MRLFDLFKVKPLRVGLSSQPDPRLYDGSVWFNVSGFGPQRRDFIVCNPAKLAKDVKKHAPEIVKQIATIDRALTPKVEFCKPTRIDVRGDGYRRIYDLEPFKLVLEQKL